MPFNIFACSYRLFILLGVVFPKIVFALPTFLYATVVRIYVWGNKIIIFYNFAGHSGCEPESSDNEKEFDEIIEKAVTDNGSVTAGFGSSNWKQIYDFTLSI